ncbi:hypothetical protein DFH06DRAFT_1133362 [Mycena polygramma]|nr:hypothetical protein DFH06DRAFT_1133362 [Mycena polygramma]
MRHIRMIFSATRLAVRVTRRACKKDHPWREMQSSSVQLYIRTIVGEPHRKPREFPFPLLAAKNIQRNQKFGDRVWLARWQSWKFSEVDTASGADQILKGGSNFDRVSLCVAPRRTHHNPDVHSSATQTAIPSFMEFSFRLWNQRSLKSPFKPSFPIWRLVVTLWDCPLKRSCGLSNVLAKNASPRHRVSTPLAYPSFLRLLEHHSDNSTTTGDVLSVMKFMGSSTVFGPPSKPVCCCSWNAFTSKACTYPSLHNIAHTAVSRVTRNLEDAARLSVKTLKPSPDGIRPLGYSIYLGLRWLVNARLSRSSDHLQSWSSLFELFSGKFDAPSRLFEVFVKRHGDALICASRNTHPMPIASNFHVLKLG